MTHIAGEYMHVCSTIFMLYMVHCTLWVTLFCQEGCRRKKEKNDVT